MYDPFRFQVCKFMACPAWRRLRLFKKIGSLEIAVKKKFGEVVFGAKRQKQPHSYHASRLFPTTQKIDLLETTEF